MTIIITILDIMNNKGKRKSSMEVVKYQDKKCGAVELDVDELEMNELADHFNKKIKLSNAKDELEWRKAWLYLQIKQLDERRIKLIEQINLLNEKRVNEERYWSIVIT